MFTPLAQQRPDPMTMDERAAYHGRVYALEHELIETKQQIQSIYAECEKLRGIAASALAREQAAATSAQFADSQLREAREKLGEVLGELATEREETRRLRAVLPANREELEAERSTT
jgi:chromosome segregation ATPase